MRFDFEIGEEGGEHLLIVPVHSHVVDLAVDPQRVQQGLQTHLLELEGVAAETR